MLDAAQGCTTAGKCQVYALSLELFPHFSPYPPFRSMPGHRCRAGNPKGCSSVPRWSARSNNHPVDDYRAAMVNRRTVGIERDPAFLHPQVGFVTGSINKT